MSRVQDLIAELCPHGVPHPLLGEITQLTRGTTITKETTSVGLIPVISGGQKPAYFHDKPNRPENTVVVAGSGAYAGFVSWWDEPIWVADAFSVIPKDNSLLNPKYVYYFLRSKQAELHSMKQGHGVPHVYPKTLAKLPLPWPPLPVQEEIVRILDTFTALEAELEAELEARKKQYEHYREHLLSVDSCQVPFVSIGDGFHIRNGYTPSKANSENWTNGTVPWFRLEDIRQKGRVLSASMQSIPESAVKGGRKFPANTLLFATSATVGEHALVTVEHLSNQRFTAVWPKEDFAHRFDMKFLFYYGFKIDHWCKENTSTSSFASVDMSGFKKIEIPILPLSEQRVIAKQLDSLDALVNDLNAGLPGELHARRRQYEYYRDKLLTFKEAS
jgi:type I restriction enzyme S subunit